MNTRDVLCRQDLIAARDYHYGRLSKIFQPADPDHVFMLWGCYALGATDRYQEPERWVREGLEDLARKSSLLLDRHVFRPLVVEPGYYGVHFVDRMLGARVFELTPGNWQCNTLSQPVGRLEPPDLDKDPTWDLERRTVQAFLEAGVSVPAYGLPTLSSAINVAINLYGQDLLTSMYTDPEAVHHDLNIINDLICTLHRWYIEHLPAEQLQPVLGAARTQPPGYSQLCGCATHLLSPDLYREFFAGHDATLLSVYPNGGMIHLCGAHTQHIEVWREMAPLRVLQMQDRAVCELETYFNEMPEDTIFYPIPCEGMPIERIVEITGGRRVIILADQPNPIPLRPASEMVK